jgi:Raf kinase inhibitor-like YbhB/YbcL family protein
MRKFGVTMLVLPVLTFAASAEEQKMKINSPEFSEGGSIPTRFTCDGEDVSPPLEFANVPENAKSLALIVDDPDAPSGTFTHWIVWGLEPDTKNLAPATVPSGPRQGKNDFGKTSYGGPCPPSGTHRYFFRLYALDKQLDLRDGSTRAELERAMKEHLFDAAVLMGKYSRARR